MLNHISFGEGEKSIAILIPTKDLNKNSILENYVNPLVSKGVRIESIIAFNLDQNEKGKSPVKTVIKPCLDNLSKVLHHLSIKNVLICDAPYFKSICKIPKIDFQHGYANKTIWKGITGFYCPNHNAIFHNPAIKSKIDISLNALSNIVQNMGVLFQISITEDCQYLTTFADIKNLLDTLSIEPLLSCDIETTSLKVGKGNIISIAFAKNTKEGYAFLARTPEVKKLLKKFFMDYQGSLVFHGAPFDTKFLISEIFMEYPHDLENMLLGLHTLYRNLEDTKILAYIALNTTAGISLSLKDLAFEFTGKYALENISNIASIPTGELLEYNCIDALATCYVYQKYRDEVFLHQKDLYQNLFIPALKTITQMELCGMPINMNKVLYTENTLSGISNTQYSALMNHPVILEFQEVQREQSAEKANTKLKKLRKTKEDFADQVFNPKSSIQVAKLLYSYLGLPVLELTEAGSFSVKTTVLKTLIERINNSSKLNKDYIPLIEHIIELNEVSKILSTFIPAFKENTTVRDNWQYLQGSFNLGGTKSGRLSSSEPNLQNIPSTGTKYAKIVKKCFQAPDNWLMIGADYASLEDRISALLTKDKNKIAIYTDGYDGHCLRAYNYFSNQMPDIDPTSVQSINSIAVKYPSLRNLSKSPTFLLTYMGTWKGLVKNFGFKEETAKQIEENYHKLYSESDEWVKKQIQMAQKTGYVELAFGLRLRTPILPQVVLESDSLPFQAHKEIKTAGNALGQSYGLLNTHSANLFMERVWNSEYSTSILPIAQIHDSQYYMVKNSLNCLKWVNDNLVECMEWNDLPPIQHPIVKLQASLEIYYPDWSSPVSIPNRISKEDLHQHLLLNLSKLKN